MEEQDAPDPFVDLREWAEKTERRVRRERRSRLLAGKVPVVLVGIAALVVLGIAVPAVRAMIPEGGSDVVASHAIGYPTESAPPGVTVTTSVSAPPTDPFAGTPAATYPKGEAGISLPGTAVPGFTKAQVDAALQQVRKALVAGRLDHRMLIGHDPSVFLKLIAAGQRDDVRKAFFNGKDMENLATWIAPTARLDPREQPRVSGRITVASFSVGFQRELRITTNFIWVYAFSGAPDSPLAAVHDEIEWNFATTGGKDMSVGDTKSYMAWADCSAFDKGMLAPGAAAVHPAPSDTEDPKAILRSDHTLDIGNDCK
jgi:hypothetical protein